MFEHCNRLFHSYGRVGCLWGSVFCIAFDWRGYFIFQFSKYTKIPKWWKVLTIAMGRLPRRYLLLTCLTKRYIPALRLSFCLAYMVFSLHFLCRKKKDKRQYVFPSIQCRWRGYKCLLASVWRNDSNRFRRGWKWWRSFGWGSKDKSFMRKTQTKF